MNDLDLDTLNPGIRRLVRLLRKAGFETTDSGDGVSNAHMECAMDQPNVHIICDPSNMARVSDELYQMLSKYSLDTCCDPDDGPFIQASYNPADGDAMISLIGVDDDTLWGGP